MAWYPGARKMELQPESDSQPAITPTQFIMHSIAAPWTKERTYEYWDQSTNLESHFGQSFDGSIAQYIGTETRADANYLANRRADGTGAVSIETASNNDHTDPWTDAQVEGLISLGVWLHQRHGIPLRICRTASDPGYGYHRLHADWAVGGTACPGDARVEQFKDVIFPAIVARASGRPSPTTPTIPTAPIEEDPMAGFTPDDVAHSVLYWLNQSMSPTPEVPGGGHPLANVVPSLAAKFKAYDALIAALPAKCKMTPAEIGQALADGTLKVTVTVAPAATPKAV
ncbi:N-acetylmuramoyl-L-alanine amidase [Streptomyces sp. NPDC059447]|uniref:peptidoglycan recognition protein family protein n=1 Tax=Streptomyces sp. NPDC059447 TaxID=3346834 RepID=UPI00368820C7